MAIVSSPDIQRRAPYVGLGTRSTKMTGAELDIYNGGQPSYNETNDAVALATYIPR